MILVLAGLSAVDAGLLVATSAPAGAATAVWGPPTQLSGTPGGGGYLEGVSCTSATDCTAVGFDRNGEPIYATESGGTWGTTPSSRTPPAMAASSTA